MNKLNCYNCGSPIDSKLHKCPYCDTSYFDMSCIDITNNEPFYLKLKIDINGKQAYITQLVKPSIEGITFTNDTSYITDAYGNTMVLYTGQRYVTTNISFEGIPNRSGSIITVETTKY